MTLQHIINIDGIESYADNSLLLSAVVMSVYYANISTKRTENLDMCGICVNTHTHNIYRHSRLPAFYSRHRILSVQTELRQYLVDAPLYASRL